jgi:uncharacterized protein YbbK (DUF523 family)
MTDKVKSLKEVIDRNKDSKIIVSACLTGVKCRYDGNDCMNDTIKKLVHNCSVPVCPEVLGGLSTSRIPAEIICCDGSDLLNGNAKIINRQGDDVTEFFKRGAEKTLEIAKELQVVYAILKSRSPSCGTGEIYDGTFSGKLRKGYGITAIKLKEAGITVVSDEEWLSMERE